MYIRIRSNRHNICRHHISDGDLLRAPFLRELKSQGIDLHEVFFSNINIGFQFSTRFPQIVSDNLTHVAHIFSKGSWPVRLCVIRRALHKTNYQLAQVVSWPPDSVYYNCSHGKDSGQRNFSYSSWRVGRCMSLRVYVSLSFFALRKKHMCGWLQEVPWSFSGVF